MASTNPNQQIERLKVFLDCGTQSTNVCMEGIEDVWQCINNNTSLSDSEKLAWINKRIERIYPEFQSYWLEKGIMKYL